MIGLWIIGLGKELADLRANVVMSKETSCVKRLNILRKITLSELADLRADVDESARIARVSLGL